MHPLFNHTNDVAPTPTSEPRNKRKRFWFQLALVAVVLGGLCASPALAQHDWNMTITVDNDYTIYFGDSLLSTPTLVGGDGDWTDTEVYSVTGVDVNAFLYVATASDHSVAQGFIGEFRNLTTGNTLLTNDDSGTPWEVFPAGAYLVDLNASGGPTFPTTVWPAGVQPTQAQVQTAVNYATTNNKWVTPVSLPGWDNSGGAFWPIVSLVPAAAEWIWHDSGNDGSATAPFDAFNHQEFLVFRIAGLAVPEPGSAMLTLLAMSAWGFIPRRKRTVRHVTH